MSSGRLFVVALQYVHDRPGRPTPVQRGDKRYQELADRLKRKQSERERPKSFLRVARYPGPGRISTHVRPSEYNIRAKAPLPIRIPPPILIIDGVTGAGKTSVLTELRSRMASTIEFIPEEDTLDY